MKRALILCALACSQCLAQDTAQTKPRVPRHEISVSYGYFTRPQVETGLRLRREEMVFYAGMDDKESSMAPYLFNETRPFSYYNWKRTGALIFTYRHQIIPKLSAGITLSYEENKCDIGYGYSGLGYRKVTALTVGGGARLSYYQRRSTELYGAAEGGMTRTTSEYVSLLKNVSITEPDLYSFLVQVSPIGIRLGRRLAGYAELGVGFKGILQVGASIRP